MQPLTGLKADLRSSVVEKKGVQHNQTLCGHPIGGSDGASGCKSGGHFWAGRENGSVVGNNWNPQQQRHGIWELQQVSPHVSQRVQLCC